LQSRSNSPPRPTHSDTRAADHHANSASPPDAQPDQLTVAVAAFEHLIGSPSCYYLSVGTMFRGSADWRLGWWRDAGQKRAHLSRARSTTAPLNRRPAAAGNFHFETQRSPPPAPTGGAVIIERDDGRRQGFRRSDLALRYGRPARRRSGDPWRLTGDTGNVVLGYMEASTLPNRRSDSRHATLGDFAHRIRRRGREVRSMDGRRRGLCRSAAG
jgi:hypothetical protein